MAPENTVVFPALLLLTDYFGIRDSASRGFEELAAVAALMAASARSAYQSASNFAAAPAPASA
jgi:hypothetical protein